MKTIGLLGGMSWESTAKYYTIINETVKKQLGGLNSANILIYSINFDDIYNLQKKGKWDHISEILLNKAKIIDHSGSDFLLICANTMHVVEPEIRKNINIPILHIVDEVAKKALQNNIKKIGLLGTNFTMEQDFYKKTLIDKHHIDVLIPSKNERERINDIISNELWKGQVNEESRNYFLEIIEKLHKEGASAIILGCTEISILINQDHTDILLFDTTSIHAEAAVRESLR